MTVVSRPSADVHAHDLPSGYRSEVKRAGIEHHGFPFAPKWSVDSAIALMDHIGLAMAPMSISSTGLEPGERGTLDFPASASGAAFMNLACLRSRELALPAYESGVTRVSGSASGARRVEWLGKAFSPPLRLRLLGSGP
jgi:hypothetical protein